MNTLLVNHAYSYVALSLMIAEANHALKQLDIAGWKPTSGGDVTSCYIHPPRLWAGGSFETTNHFFGFGKDGRLQFITKFDPNRDLSIQSRYEKWVKMKSLVGTNEAYQLATNWLAGLEVDLAALEKAHKPNVSQAFFYSQDERQESPERVRTVMLPRFEVKWGTNDARPAVWISIFGPTKEPIHIRQEDISFSRRPKGLVKDPERLLSIPNSEFGRYSLIQKSNLVVQSAVAPYRSFALPVAVPTNSIKPPPQDRNPAPKAPGLQRRVKSAASNVHNLEPASSETTRSRSRP